jgi:hypothetical protein
MLVVVATDRIDGEESEQSRNTKVGHNNAPFKGGFPKKWG